MPMLLPITPGDVIDNARLVEIFKCSTQGGMRRSKETNSLVLVTNEVKSLYTDEWQNGILMYTGMGTKGDQSLDFHQNKTLNESNTNGIELHLFTVKKLREYTYVGRVELAGPPEEDIQNDEDGKDRIVWRFPLRICDGEMISQDVFEQNQANTEKLAKEMTLQDLKEKIAQQPEVPKKVTIKSQTAERSPYVAEFAKKVANGMCQLCGQPAPFKDSDGTPYLESHHIVWLAQGGPDTIYNVVALCPNCHRKMHVVNDDIDVAKLKGKAAKAAIEN